MVDLEPLPSWVDPTRLEDQKHIVSDVVDRFKGRNGNPECDVVLLQAPTGVGKSLIAEMVSREIGKTIYSCSTKALQDQFSRDFPYARVLKGRSNYLTTLGMVDEMGNEVGDIDEAITAKDCTWNPDNGMCSWCSSRGECPYVRARGRAIGARLAVLNSSYLLTDAGGPRNFVNRDLYVLDEADVLESELLNHAQLHLTNRRMKRLGIKFPRYKTKDDTWSMWINDHALPRCREYADTLPFLSDTKDIREIREIKFMANLIDQLAKVRLAIPKGRWVYDGYRDKVEDGDVIFRPVLVKEFGKDLLWGNGRKFLVMSATILSGDVMADELGLTMEDRNKRVRQYDMIDVPSNFPAENRPVHVVPIADVTHANKETERPKLAAAVRGVILRHPDERVLIHCVSYELAHYLLNECRQVTGSRVLVSYGNSRGKDEALRVYKQEPNSVLFAPSMDRGIDLPDDLCRVQVIAKVPWPNKGDKRINARLNSKGGGDWYNSQAIRTLIQMSGRAVRHRQDYAVTYVLDRQFVDLWNKNQRMFPKYFRDALNFRMNPRLLTERKI